MPKQYKEEFKKQAVAYYEKCHSLCAVAEKYQVAPSTVNRWVNEYKNLGTSEAPFTLSEYRALKQKYEKMLAREFTAKRKNEKWVSDITYFKVNHYAIYLCVIIDLFSRKVVGYRISRKCSTHLVTSTFRKAFTDRGQPKDLIFHSDRGSQYISAAFQDLLKEYGVTQSFSFTGKPHDNAVAETFFATFKKEEAYHRNYTSENDFRKSVDECILFYNEKRPHATIGYKTPSCFEELHGKDG